MKSILALALVLCVAGSVQANVFSDVFDGCDIVTHVDFFGLKYSYYHVCDLKGMRYSSEKYGGTMDVTPFAGIDQTAYQAYFTNEGNEKTFFAPMHSAQNLTVYGDFDNTKSLSVVMFQARTSNSTFTFECNPEGSGVDDGLKSFEVVKGHSDDVDTLNVVFLSAGACGTTTKKIPVDKFFQYIWKAGWKYVLAAFFILCCMPCTVLCAACALCCCCVKVCCCSSSPKPNKTLYQPLAQNEAFAPATAYPVPAGRAPVRAMNRPAQMV